MGKSYSERLYDRVNSGEFVRCFLGRCPDCGARIWSIEESYHQEPTGKIKAWFVCKCGKKYKETVYPYEHDDGTKTYKYSQSLPEKVNTKKWGKQFMLKTKKNTYLITPDGIKKKKIKEA